jgi:transposase-like protein
MARPPIEPTEEIKARICEALRVGASLEHTAKYIGVSRRTLSRWIERAQNETEDGELRQFHQQLEKARADLVIALLLKINHAANKNWKAAVWMLERLHPKLYGRAALTATDPDSVVDDASPAGDGQFD